MPGEALVRLESDDLVPVARAAKRRYGRPLAEAVDWALRMRGAERPQSIDEWREVLEGGAPVPGGAVGEGVAPPVQEPRSGSRWLLVVALAAGAGGCGCLVAARERGVTCPGVVSPQERHRFEHARDGLRLGTGALRSGATAGGARDDAGEVRCCPQGVRVVPGGDCAGPMCGAGKAVSVQVSEYVQGE